jgi:hypothetical protein
MPVAYDAVQAYAVELNKRCRPHLKPTYKSCRVDETYTQGEKPGEVSLSNCRRICRNKGGIGYRYVEEAESSHGVNLKRLHYPRLYFRMVSASILGMRSSRNLTRARLMRDIMVPSAQFRRSAISL